MKTCNRCNIEKELDEFYKNRGKCKSCYHKDRKDYKNKYYQENKELHKKAGKKHRENNREHVLERDRNYIRNKRQNDTLYKLRSNISTLIYSKFKNSGYTKESKTYEILGCSYEELITHLNNNPYGFKYGDDNIDIDHIIPITSASSEAELLELNHYKNLQLLPSKYNRHIKSDKEFDREHFENWIININY